MFKTRLKKLNRFLPIFVVALFAGCYHPYLDPKAKNEHPSKPAASYPQPISDPLGVYLTYDLNPTQHYLHITFTSLNGAVYFWGQEISPSNSDIGRTYKTCVTNSFDVDFGYPQVVVFPVLIRDGKEVSFTSAIRKSQYVYEFDDPSHPTNAITVELNDVPTILDGKE